MRKYWIPLIFTATFAAGILLGNLLAQNANGGNSKQDNFHTSFYSKIDLVLDLVEENYVDGVETKDVIEEVIPQILRKLDPHSMYIPAKDLRELEEPLEGNFEGIGVQFNIKNDTIYIINTIQGGPSEKIGILAGDKIVRINDSLFAGKSIKNEDVIKNLKGKRGTSVGVHIKRNGVNELLPFVIIRDKIPIYSLTSAYMLDEHVGYIKLSRFALTSAKEFRKAAEKLIDKGMTKLIFDLRSNGGGILDAAIKISDEFLDESNLVVYTEGKSRPRVEYIATSDGVCEQIKLVILVDTWSASASEIVAGAMQDNDRAIIIGRRSFGKGLVQEPVGFNDGSAIRLTTARYYTPTGRCIQKSYKNGVEAYEEEVYHRIMQNELENEDSTHFPDSLIYTTPAGKVVYGGGGIMPDIFVPIDTSYFSPYFRKIINRGIVYQYALQYTDQNRKKIKHIKDYKSLDKYLIEQNWLSGFLAFAESKGIKTNNDELAVSQQELSLRFRAYVIRNIFNDEGFFPIFNKHDKMIEQALQALNDM